MSNRSPRISSLPGLALLASGVLLVPPAAAETLVCHVSYGGETRAIEARPVDSPYTVPVQEIGSYFLVRMVFQKEPRDLAAIRVYVFANPNGSAVPIHQATHPYPPPPATRPGYGFTGHNRVYEPIRDGELEYWCELADSSGRAP